MLLVVPEYHYGARANAGDTKDAGLVPRSGRSPGIGNGNPLQYSCLENPMDRGAYSPWGRKETRLKQLHVNTCMADGAHPFIFAFSRHLTKMKKKSVSTKILKRMGENITADKDVKMFIRCNINRNKMSVTYVLGLSNTLFGLKT